MKTYHIHIKGIVQGVGFRPYLYKYCIKNKLNGWVNNSVNGVHLQINTTQNIHQILEIIVTNCPKLAKITSVESKEIEYTFYTDFKIVTSTTKEKANLLLTPDFSICKDCENELFSADNKRFQYPFITCTNCGPRYSITQKLPYDRETTTMGDFLMCDSCLEEYNDPLDRRYYSQTNSCKHCKIKLSLYEDNTLINKDFTNLDYIVSLWEKGKIVAIKSIGGYLLTCDATNSQVISRLRKIKNRPSKPFALMYHDIYELGEDVEMGIGEMLELESSHAPIVLLSIKKDRMTPIDVEQIAPKLNTLGVMLPNTPLFKLLLNKFKKPIVATSGNLSNSTIIFKDKIPELSKISDAILSNNRNIVIPQDDSVIRYSSIKSYRTIIRRSRGLAPSYFNSELKKIPNTSVLAMGALLKSTFTILCNKNIHISQYLGNTNTFEAEENYQNTLSHFNNLFKPNTEVVLVDKHPNYFTTSFGKEIASNLNIKLKEIQHHKAHFYAVLGENNLVESNDTILGVIWDGTGLGDDGNIWGGEFFTYQQGIVKRIYHLDEFPYILGDKMPKEPRISALVMASSLKGTTIIKAKFSKTEWNIYQKLLQTSTLKSTSVGRLFDAAASIILDINEQTYEGEAAMKLESAAYRYFRTNNFTKYYSYFKTEELPDNFINFLLQNICNDLEKGFEKDFIAAKFHISLAHYISIIVKQQSHKFGINKIAFSGGVFQNQWLLELIISFMDKDFELYFHKELSPNDENISFGQLMYYLYNID